MSAATITFSKGAEGVMHNGKPYKKRAIREPTDALNATLHIILAHTAEVFNATVSAISETYGIDKAEMFHAIQTHPAYTSIQVHPAVKDLGYLLEKTDEVNAEPPAPAAAAVAEPIESLSTMMQSASLGPAPPFAQGPAPQFAQGTAPPQKKKFRIKKAAGSE